MQRALHVHAKYFAIVYTSVHAHVQKCTCTCTLSYMHMYTFVHSNEDKRSSAARNVMLRAALYVFQYYLIIFLRRNFIRHRNEAENIHQCLDLIGSHIDLPLHITPQIRVGAP